MSAGSLRIKTNFRCCDKSPALFSYLNSEKLLWPFFFKGKSADFSLSDTWLPVPAVLSQISTCTLHFKQQHSHSQPEISHLTHISQDDNRRRQKSCIAAWQRYKRFASFKRINKIHTFPASFCWFLAFYLSACSLISTKTMQKTSPTRPVIKCNLQIITGEYFFNVVKEAM